MTGSWLFTLDGFLWDITTYVANQRGWYDFSRIMKINFPDKSEVEGRQLREKGFYISTVPPSSVHQELKVSLLRMENPAVCLPTDLRVPELSEWNPMKRKKYILKDFLALYMINNQDIIYSLARGAAQKNLNMKRFREIKIPIPSNEIQQQLIQIFEQKEQRLETIQNKIESEKKYILELKELAKDIIHSYC